MSDVHDQVESLQEESVSPTSIKEYYDFLRLTIEAMESDALKSDKGNKAAGVRLRKSLRHIKGFTGDFVKFTLNKD